MVDLDVDSEVPVVGIGFGVSSFDIGRLVVPWVDTEFVVLGLVCEVLLVDCEVHFVDIGLGVSSIEVGCTVDPWVDIKCVVPGLEDVLGVAWGIPVVDIGVGVSSSDVGCLFVVVSCIVLLLVVEACIGSGVSPLVEGDVPIGSVVDSFCGVSCVVCEVWVVFGVSPVCIGVGLSWLGDSVVVVVSPVVVG